MSRSRHNGCSGGRGCYVCGDAGENRRAAEADAARADERTLPDELEALQMPEPCGPECECYPGPRPHVGMAEHEATLPFATLGEAAARYGAPTIQVPTRAQQIAMAADACAAEPREHTPGWCRCGDYHRLFGDDPDPTAIEGCPCCEDEP